MVTWQDYLDLRGRIRNAGLEVPPWHSLKHWDRLDNYERKYMLRRIAEDTGLISDKPTTGSENAW
jgi:hypothetical protein